MVVDGRSSRLSRTTVVMGGSFCAFLALRLTLDGVFSVFGVILTPSVGLAVPLGVGFGLPAAVGVAVGAFVAQTYQVGFSLMAVFAGLSMFVLATVASLGWQSEVRINSGTLLDVVGVAGLVVVTAIGAIGAAAVLGWGGELVGRFPFYVTVLDAVERYLVATAIVGPPLFVGIWVASSRQPRVQSPTPTRSVGLGFVAVPVLWAAVAFVGSVGFNIRERLSQAAFEIRDIEPLYTLIHPDIFGRGGRRAQVVFGAVMLVLWAFTTRSRTLSDPKCAASETVHEDEGVRSSIDSEKTTVSSRSEEMEAR
jgi:hypothetical protein